MRNSLNERKPVFPLPDGALEERCKTLSGAFRLGQDSQQPAQRRMEQFDSIGGRNRTVVEVAGDGDQVDFFMANEVDQPVDEQRLLVEQAVIAERPAEMPVAGMQNALLGLGVPTGYLLGKQMSKWCLPACQNCFLGLEFLPSQYKQMGLLASQMLLQGA